jgi:hypothetical protein
MPRKASVLVHSAEYADKLLADVESVLSASESKSPFRRCKNSLLPAQVKVVGNYIARIRAQMVRALDAHGIPLPEPKFESIHAIRVTPAFVRVAFEECSASRMRSYGDVPESKIYALNGYRAHLDQLATSDGGSDTDEARIRRNLDSLAPADSVAVMES